MNRYSLTIMILSVAMASISAWKSDWDSFLVAIIGIALVCAPFLATGDTGKGYDRRLMVIAIFPLLLFIALFLVGSLFQYNYYREASLAIDALALMAFGMMVAVLLNARTSVTLPRRWVILFAYVFACSVSVLFIFSAFIWMASEGYPLYNGDFQDGQSNDLVNKILILPGAITVISGIIYSIVLNMYLKRKDHLELSQLVSGDGP
jgi:hypothetical protein